MDRRAGFTLIEMLVVLAILAIATVALVHVSRGEPDRSARAFAVHLRAARLQAVVGGRAVAAFGTCSAHGFVAGGGVSIVLPPRGLQFTPEGLPRTCAGAAVANATIELAHRGRRAAVIVASLGRVRWEPR
jgi:prepilin-type N-terminal cleavage/methylation domain-containing protein